MDKNSKPTKVTHKPVKKLTANDLKRITAGGPCSDCHRSDPSCIAYIVSNSAP